MIPRHRQWTFDFLSVRLILPRQLLPKSFAYSLLRKAPPTPHYSWRGSSLALSLTPGNKFTRRRARPRHKQFQPSVASVPSSGNKRFP